MNRIWAYVPGAHDDQRLHVSELLGSDVTHWYTEVALREQVLRGIGHDDVLVVESLADLGRTPGAVLRRVVRVLHRGATIVVIEDRLTMHPSDTNMLAPIARIGGQRSPRKADAAPTGPAPVISDSALDEVRARLVAGETVSALAAELGVHRVTLYRALKRGRPQPQ